MEFVANATGNFRITFHAGGETDEADHGAVFESETMEQGDTFSFVVPDDVTGKTKARRQLARDRRFLDALLEGADKGGSGEA